MYKVITHTIKEEHFTHPRTVEHALSMQGGNVHLNKNNISITNEQRKQTADDQFSESVKALVEKYVYAVRNAIVSILHGSEDLLVLEEEIKKCINDINNSISTVFIQSIQSSAYSVVPTFLQQLTKFTTALLDIAKAQ